MHPKPTAVVRRRRDRPTLALYGDEDRWRRLSTGIADGAGDDGPANKGNGNRDWCSRSRGDGERFAAAAGLKVRCIHYLNMPGFFAWWLNFRVLRRESQSALQIALFDSIVPLASRMERLATPPFGQSLFCVLVQ